MAATHTILVVEDEEMLNEVLVQVLENEGYNVISAYDGKSALDIFEQQNDIISAVLSDVGLPKMDGTKLLEQFKKINPDIPVLLSSGFIDPTVKTKMIHKGVKEFIKKPYEPNEVLTKIRAALEDR